MEAKIKGNMATEEGREGGTIGEKKVQLTAMEVGISTCVTNLEEPPNPYFVTEGSESLTETGLWLSSKLVKRALPKPPDTSCEKLMVKGKSGMGLCALRDMKKVEEFTFDYCYGKVLTQGDKFPAPANFREDYKVIHQICPHFHLEDKGTLVEWGNDRQVGSRG
ncbi:histone-lysine N-methyltransferase ASHH2 isoform X1 [Sesbania bispinosa]|nr:histone-lysine N-methyltransferase ASHH2 isoform X1 [Sesbania bispinosa]